MKGIRSSSQNKKCALCRVDFSLETIEQNLSVPETNPTTTSSESQWFYSGKNDTGWWKYDERTTQDIEEAFQKPDIKSVVISIVGFFYTVDFEKMIQFRTSDPSRHRKIKRETKETIQKDFNIKGVAGLRTQEVPRVPEADVTPTSDPSKNSNQSDSEDSAAGSSHPRLDSVSSSVEQLVDLVSKNLHINDNGHSSTH